MLGEVALLDDGATWSLRTVVSVMLGCVLAAVVVVFPICFSSARPSSSPSRTPLSGGSDATASCIVDAALLVTVLSINLMSSWMTAFSDTAAVTVGLVESVSRPPLSDDAVP